MIYHYEHHTMGSYVSRNLLRVDFVGREINFRIDSVLFGGSVIVQLVYTESYGVPRGSHYVAILERAYIASLSRGCSP